MVNLTDMLQGLKDKRTELSVLALTVASAAVSVLFDLRHLATFLAALAVAALAGMVLMRRRLEELSDEARRAAADYAALSNRLARIERQLRLSADDPALRSTMADVNGKVGLLGGVVRDLARNVAAQTRDVADLRDTLRPKPGEIQPPALGGTVETRPSPELPPRPLRAEPEPSRLPPIRAEDELRRMRLVTQAFEADRIELHLQPIVALPQRKIRFYEALARLRLVDGTLLGPSEFLPLLERVGRAPEFDRRILGRATAVARHLVARGSEAIVGVNFSPRSVAEPGFLWSLTGLLDAAPDALGKIVLELSQACWRGLDADQKTALAALRERSVPMSLDRATDLHFDARALADLGIRFMKLPAEALIAASERPGGSGLDADSDVRDYATLLRREGIKLVAEHVEREEMVPALADLGVPLAQGFVFAAPRAVKADVIGEGSHPADAQSEPSSFLRAG